MVQGALAYVALGLDVLLVVAGALALRAGASNSTLSPHRRRVVGGGVAGLILFLLAAVM